MSTPYLLILPTWFSARSGPGANVQLRFLLEPKIRPQPLATVQVRMPTLTPPDSARTSVARASDTMAVRPTRRRCELDMGPSLAGALPGSFPSGFDCPVRAHGTQW